MNNKSSNLDKYFKNKNRYLSELKIPELNDEFKKMIFRTFL